MVDTVKRGAVDEIEVLIIVAAMHIEAAGEFHSFLHTTHALERLDDVGRGEKRELRLDVVT